MKILSSFTQVTQACMRFFLLLITKEEVFLLVTKQLPVAIDFHSILFYFILFYFIYLFIFQ